LLRVTEKSFTQTARFRASSLAKLKRLEVSIEHAPSPPDHLDQSSPWGGHIETWKLALYYSWDARLKRPPETKSSAAEDVLAVTRVLELASKQKKPRRKGKASPVPPNCRDYENRRFGQWCDKTCPKITAL
jgi:hypothetical protein